MKKLKINNLEFKDLGKDLIIVNILTKFPITGLIKLGKTDKLCRELVKKEIERRWNIFFKNVEDGEQKEKMKKGDKKELSEELLNYILNNVRRHVL